MKNPKFLILISGYNCDPYVKGCIDSIKSQTYKNYHVVIMSDGSTDQTVSTIYDNAPSNKKWSHGASYERQGTVSIKEFNLSFDNRDCDVIVWLDLDDEFEPNALERVAKEYEDDNCWLTYGSWVNSQGEKWISKPPVDENFRQGEFIFTALKTFRKELYYKLTNEDLFPAQREIYPDCNMLYCLLELAGIEHIRAIPDIIYRYNTNNPLNVVKLYTPEQRAKEHEFIRSLKPKEKLLSL